MRNVRNGRNAHEPNMNICLVLVGTVVFDTIYCKVPNGQTK